MKTRFQKVPLYIVFIGWVLQISLAQDSIKIDSNEFNDQDSSVQQNDTLIATVNSIIPKLDLNSNGIDTVQLVTPMNQPPVFAKNKFDLLIKEDGLLSIPISFFSSFVEDPDDSLTLANWKIESGNNVNKTIVGDTLIVFPNENWFGIDTLMLNVSDGESSVRALLIINIIPENDPPVFVEKIPELLMNEDSQHQIIVSEIFDYVEDPDHENTELRWMVLPGSNIKVEQIGNTITFLPKSNWFGKEVINIIVSDGELSDSTSIPLNVLPINDPPTFTQHIPQFYLIEDELFSIKLSFFRDYYFDIDDNRDSLIITIQNGKNVSHFLENNSLRLISYRDWFGKDSLNITISDGEYDVQSSFYVGVQSVNDPPIFSLSLQDTFVFEDNDLVIPLKYWYTFVSDVDHADNHLVWRIINSSFFNSHYQPESITLTPKGNWNGYDQIKVRVTDGYLSDTSQFSIRTIALNDPPVISELSDIVMNEDEVLKINMIPFMSDIDNDLIDLTWSFVSDFSGNRMAVNKVQYNPWDIGSFLKNSNNGLQKTKGEKTYRIITVIDSIQTALIKPPENYFTDNISFIAQLTDPMGGMDIGMFNVVINPVNDPPILQSIPHIIFNEDEQYSNSLSLWFPFVHDIDHEDNELLWKIQGEPNGISKIIKNDSLFFFSAENWFGSDTVSLSVTDGEFIDETELIISVLPINDPPNPFELINYTKGDSLNYTFNWYPSFDIENDSIEYHFYVSGGVLDTVIHKINKTHFTFGGDGLFEPYVPYTWFVAASDQTDTVQCVERFDLKIQIAPRVFGILPNYPNPFNHNTTIPYNVQYESMVEIDILDINGKLIKRLVQQTKPDGRHQIDWDGTDKFARPVATGMYLIVMEAGGKAMMRKIMYIK